MNTASESRLSLARRVASAYSANPKVVAVIAGGSSARGHADRYSDVDIGVFWHAAPIDTDRSSVIEAVRGDLIRLYPYDTEEKVWCDDFMMGRAHSEQPRSGVLIEVVHYMTGYMEEVIHDVLEQHDTDILKHNLIAGIQSGLPLQGRAQLEAWRNSASVYPDALALAVVKRHAQIDHFWRWQMWLERGDNLLMLYGSYNQIQQKLLHVLLALNHVYYFGFKRLD